MRTRKRACPTGADERDRGKETNMAHSSSASRQQPGTTGAGTPAQQRKPTASRSARRRHPHRRLLPRIIVLAVTLALLAGIIALVRAASLSTPSSNAFE